MLLKYAKPEAWNLDTRWGARDALQESPESSHLHHVVRRVDLQDGLKAHRTVRRR